jgi:uncharacterized membrane protein
MHADWRLIAIFGAVGAYFLGRFFGASVLASVGVAVVVGLITYALTRTRGRRS